MPRKDPIARKEYAHKYRLEHKELIKERRLKYRQEHGERLNELCRKNYHNNPKPHILYNGTRHIARSKRVSVFF